MQPAQRMYEVLMLECWQYSTAEGETEEEDEREQREWRIRRRKAARGQKTARDLAQNATLELHRMGRIAWGASTTRISRKTSRLPLPHAEEDQTHPHSSLAPLVLETT